MEKNYKHVAIIPARAGSKSVPNKNLTRPDGKMTLVDRTVAVAIRSNIFSRIILTTNIPTVIEDYKENRIVKVRRRPENLCTDDALMIDVVKDIVNCFEISRHEWLWLLQPTSPFRTTGHIHEIKEKIDEGMWRSVIGVKEMLQEHPDRAYLKHREKLTPLKHTNFKNKENLMPLYMRNGCFYVAKCGDVLDKGSLFIEECCGYVMDAKSSINIDSPFELEIARLIVGNRLKL